VYDDKRRDARVPYIGGRGVRFAFWNEGIPQLGVKGQKGVNLLESDWEQQYIHKRPHDY
jgi:hypothetical protein